MSHAELHLAVRSTARLAFLVFMVVFSTAALHALWPSRATRWLRRNRRWLGLTFAAIHTVHLGLVLTLASVEPGVFKLVAGVAGGLAYAFILFMAATSFDTTARWVGKRAWRIGHTAGIWWVWMIFALAYVGRVRDPRAWPLAALAVGGVGLRVAAWLKRRSRKQLARREDLAA